MNNAARRQQQQWTALVGLFARSHRLDPGILDQHAAEYHYVAGDQIRLVLAEAAGCLVAGGDLDDCV